MHNNNKNPWTTVKREINDEETNLEGSQEGPDGGPKWDNQVYGVAKREVLPGLKSAQGGAIVSLGKGEMEGREE